ncbi:transposase family protein, partial [Candidatus Parcubacteria bacterium]
KDKDAQRTYYSGKKKRHTVKNNVVVDEQAKICLLTPTCEGKKHDKKVSDEANIRLPEGSILYQDTGFQGFALEGVTIIQPKKKPRGKELTTEEKAYNREISRVRIRVEHAIAGVKRYRIVKDRNRNWKKGFRDLVMETCCGLHNFRLNFRPWHYDPVPT